MLYAASKYFVVAFIATILSSNSITKVKCSKMPSDLSPVDYTGTEYLDNAQKYFVTWSISNAEKTIYFEVTAETRGFVGFGISPKGGMTEADILVAGVLSNGSIYSADYHGVANTNPVEDAHSDWIVTNAAENDTHTTIKFHRLLNTCDEDDFEITDATMRLIWALGESDEVAYHKTNRGTKSVNLYLQNEYEFRPDEYETIDLLVNLTMPAYHTSYWCSIHKAPKFDEKQHIVAFDAVLENDPALQHTHHFIVYRCVAPPNQNPEDLFEPWVSHPGDHCFGTNPVPGFPFAPYCNRYAVYIWSKGGKRLVFPPNLGLPIPDTLGRREYYALEIHYDNPQIISGLQFQTGARLYYTNKTREMEVGLFLVNHDVVAQLLVPPQVSDYIVAGHCSGECTNNFLPEDGITLFNNLFHAHLAGRKLKLRHFRGNTELPWVDVDTYYDFDYQQNKMLSSFRKLERGDQLTVECTYDSMNAERKMAVVGGQATKDEMCEAIMYYYPKLSQPFFYCGSAQNITEHMGLFGITEFRERNYSLPGEYQKFEVIKPEHMAGEYQESVSFKVNWTQEFLEEFQQVKRYGEQLASCMDGNDNFVGKVKYPENLAEYVPPNKCENGSRGTKTSLKLLFLVICSFAIFN